MPYRFLRDEEKHEKDCTHATQDTCRSWGRRQARRTRVDLVRASFMEVTARQAYEHGFNEAAMTLSLNCACLALKVAKFVFLSGDLSIADFGFRLQTMLHVEEFPLTWSWLSAVAAFLNPTRSDALIL